MHSKSIRPLVWGLLFGSLFFVLACDLSTVRSLVSPEPTRRSPDTTAPTKLPVSALKVTHPDAANDCLSNTNNASVACNPRGLDIVSVTISRPNADGDLTISLELAGNGLKDLKARPVWALTYAFDLDRNIATGMRNIFPAQHRMGPELTLLYGEAGGSVRQVVKRYDASGRESDGDASLAKWSLPDDNHIIVVIAASLITAKDFYVVGDITVTEMYDHFVEDGYLTFPDGQAISQVSPTAAPPATIVSAPTRSPEPQTITGTITSAVLARAASPLTSAPLGVTDTFPPDGRIHVNIAVANAPSGTTLKAVWSAVNATGVPANTEITSQQTSPQGTRNVNIEFFGTTRLPLGTYKIDILLNGKLDRTLSFSVKDGVAAFRTPTPRALGSCVPVSPTYKPPLIARKITMAEGVNTSTFEPVNATRLFKISSVFHAIVELDNAAAGTKIKAVWYATDTGGLEPCNTRLGESEVTTSGGAKVWFNFRPPDKWPIGNYKVDIFANDALNIDTEFRVQ